MATAPSRPGAGWGRGGEGGWGYLRVVVKACQAWAGEAQDGPVAVILGVADGYRRGDRGGLYAGAAVVVLWLDVRQGALWTAPPSATRLLL